MVHFVQLCAVVACEQITPCQKCQSFLKEFFHEVWHIRIIELQFLFKFNTGLKELFYDLLGKDSAQQECIGQTLASFSVSDER